MYEKNVPVNNLVILIAALITLLAATAFAPSVTEAVQCDADAEFEKTVDEHGAIMLFIETGTGRILYANKTAVEFYGYSKEELTSMTLTHIDELSREEIAYETLAAANKEKNFFILKHRLANGQLRTVEVYTYPVEYRGQSVLFSIIHDITPKVMLEEKHRKTDMIIFFIAIIASVILLLLVINLNQRTKSLTQAYNKMKIFDEQTKAFTDSDVGFVYLKDEHLKYMFINKAAGKEFFKLPRRQIIGKDTSSLFLEQPPEEFELLDSQVLEQHKMITKTIPWGNKYYRTTKFPVQMLNGTFGVGAHITDVTEEHERQRARKRTLEHQWLLLEILTRAFESKQKLLDYTLHELLRISGSGYGYIYFYSEEKEEFTLNTWTRGAMKDCTVVGEPKVYQLAKTGIWGEVVRQRKPIIVNDFAAKNPLKKGYPEGHVILKRFMSVPIFMDGQIVAVIGLANKQTDYNETDMQEMTTLMSGVWNAVQRREIKETLIYERNKYFQTLLSIGDGVMVVDRDKNIEFLNSIAAKLTGWTPEEAKGVPYLEVFVLSHEKEGHTINDPIDQAFSTGKVQELGNHAVLTAKNGDKYYLEDSAAPILDDKGDIAGVVLVFRDITEKREHRKKIEYLSFHDALTGLYNRHFFEEELRRLDTPRNLPISIALGDVNSLKMVNDIFGHQYGDMLLKKVTKAMKDTCRTDDIIARWGGDEFVLLLPKTTTEEAEIIVQRIKKAVSALNVRAIKLSISLAHDTKSEATEDIMQALNNAESKMYSEKTLEQENIHNCELNAIFNALYAGNEAECRHAMRVSKIYREFGRALQLPESDIITLAKAGRLHNVGEIVLNDEEACDKHPEVGYRMLNYFDGMHELAKAVLAHHENWDGSGYPKGLKGEEIPLFARIIAIVEAYDSMLHPRDYSDAKSKADAIQEIELHSGTKFDPDLVRAFTQMLRPLFL